MKTGFKSNLAWFLAMLMIMMTPFSGAWALTTGSSICSSGLGMPPFLSQGGIPPNMMIIIDNSASMYDLAYIDSTSVSCFDESYPYDPTITDPDDPLYMQPKVFAGYFDPATSYKYDMTNKKFVALTAAEAIAAWAAATYSGTDAAIQTSANGVDEYNNALYKVDAFAAKGNLLNWAASSKFDIEKQILTGGKYDSTAQNLVMETRGCLNHRYVKQYAMADSVGTTYYLTLGVRPPMPTQYDAWKKGASYAVGDIVFDPFVPEKMTYKCTAAGISNGNAGPTTDTAPLTWAIYTDEQRYKNTAYPVGATVTDPSENNTVNEGRMYICVQAGTTPDEDGKTVYTDNDAACATCPKWETHNLTHIDIFPVTTDGFDDTDCALAVAEMQKESPNQGLLKGYIDDCMEYDNDSDNRGAQRASFNHAIHNCWYYAKHDAWQPGGGSVSAMQSACENVYNYNDPWSLTPWDPAYACYGIYQEITDAGGTVTDYYQLGYVGRCFKLTGTDCTCTSGKLTDDFINFMIAWYAGKGITKTEADIQSCECTKALDMQFFQKYGYHCCTEAANVWDCETAPCISPGMTLPVITGYTCDGIAPKYKKVANIGTLCTKEASELSGGPYEGCCLHWSPVYAAGGPGGGESAVGAVEPVVEGFDPAAGGGTGAGGGPGSTPAWGAWVAGQYASVDACILKALQDYCGILSLPPVIDYSDVITDTGGESVETWNLPAVLIDSGVAAQLNEPMQIGPDPTPPEVKKDVAMKGLVAQATAPQGLIQQYAKAIRMGIMSFNYDGSDTECASASANPLFDCANPSIRDGGSVLQELGLDDAADPYPSATSHTALVVDAINDIKGDTWTPLAEAMFNAVGYYAQDTNLRLNDNDWQVAPPPAGEARPEPIQYWCQENHILMITDGAATTDQNAAMTTYITTDANDANDNEGADDTALVDCTPLFGSTFLDDLTYFGQNSDIFGTLDGSPKQNILSHIVVSGSLRNTGTGECNPTTLMTNAAINGGTELLMSDGDPQKLRDQLVNVLESVRAGTASGSAASVISASRGGEGAIYQAIFWPKELDGDPEIELDTRTATWFGEVHSLLINAEGIMFEDTDGDKAFSAGDQRVVVYFDEDEMKSRACYGELNASGDCVGTVGEIQDVKYLWSVSDWLGSITEADIVENRATYISDVKKRYIFTWNDLNADGAIDANEQVPFTAAAAIGSLAVTGTRAPVPYDFGVTTAAKVNEIVNWVRGLDTDDDPATVGVNEAKRNRRLDLDEDNTPETYYRLGDVVHSTPMAVARPAEGLHLIYRDQSYAQFFSLYRHRRHMIYFGGNDGMIHAVNGGFYDETQKAFFRTASFDNTSGPELGAEMWAYVPYNLQPHLNCLTEPGYAHKYYMDQQPRVFDAKIFTPDGVHKEGWGTVLVMGMRLGGYPVQMSALDLNGTGDADYPDDPRVLASSYVIFDITDPEHPPVLMAEMTYTGDGVDAGTNREMNFTCTSGVSMGYTSVDPGVTAMKEGNAYSFNLLLGSGPTYSNNILDKPEVGSEALPRLAVVDLERIAAGGVPLRIPAALPDAGTDTGSFVIGTDPGYLGDIVVVDYDLKADYMTDAVYFGTVTGSNENWAGKLYRLVTHEPADYSGEQTLASAHEWSSLSTANLTANPSVLFNVGEPITAQPTVGTDLRNYWVYVGTGKFMDGFDKVDESPRGFYAIKEPQEFTTVGYECAGHFTWDTVEFIKNSGTGTDDTPGEFGLWRVDQIGVVPTATAEEAEVNCIGGSTDCLPKKNPMDSGSPRVEYFDELRDAIAGVAGICPGASPPAPAVPYEGYGLDGWWRRFDLPRERNLGEAALLGGLLTFTTYQPFEDVCMAEGLSYLYGLYYKTGTAWHQPIFDGGTLTDAAGNVEEKIAIGRGMALTPNVHKGEQEGKTDFVQTSTGAIVEIPEFNLPVKALRSGRSSWKEIDAEPDCGP